MSEPVQPPEEDAGPPSEVDQRMVEILSGTASSGRSAKDLLDDDSSEQAEDLIGRLNALEFIDSVIGEDSENPGQIGEFEVQGVLGRGGMGTVYLAYQESLDREVALKVLAPRFSSDVTMRKRFRKEAKATAAMHHQHIVPIYDYGEAGGHLFFAMERVKGVSLDKHISAARRHDTGAMEPLDAARRFAGVADALALAHKRQILHRDVKPGNILVHDDGTLALADFGLSKFLGEASQHHLTSVGGFLGTLHYSPPEQARGEKICPASDLYSLGVTMFEVITGHLPLSGDSTEAILQNLLHEHPKRLREYLPKVSRDLDLVLEKLLHKDPRDRYQDGEALALDLLRVAEGEPVRIRRQSLPTRLYRRFKRNPVQASIAVSLVVVLVVTVLYLRSLMLNKEINRSVEVRQHLRNASQALAVEPGLLLGRHAILAALTGQIHEQPEGASRFLSELDAAIAKLGEEEDQQAYARMRRAYFGGVFRDLDFQQEDPVVLLVNGWGYRAVQLLSDKIEQIEQAGTTFDDLAVRLNLYHLYLVRALAHLTASDADLDKAENDLRLASFIRSGAFLPRLLRVLAAWRNWTDPQVLIQGMQALIDEDPQRRQVIGELLCAVAGLCGNERAHLMRFELSHRNRRILHEQGLEWCGKEADERIRYDADPYAGLDQRLFELAIDLQQRLGNTQQMQQVQAAADRLLKAEAIAPHCRLQAWRQTFRLLQNSSAELTPELMQLGSLHYLRVLERRYPDKPEQIRALLTSDLTERLRAVIELAPDSMVAIQIDTRLRVYAGQAQQALARVEQWLRLDAEDPQPYQYRFMALLDAPVPPSLDQRRVEIGTAASHALNYCIDRDARLHRLVEQVDARRRGGRRGPVRALLDAVRSDLGPSLSRSAAESRKPGD